MPVIGFLDTRSSDGMTSRLASFRQGLKEVGIVEGENIMVIYRWAEDRVDRLPDQFGLVSSVVSSPTRNTMGIFVVASLAANAEGGPPVVTITVACWASSRAMSGRRSTRSSAQR